MAWRVVRPYLPLVLVALLLATVAVAANTTGPRVGFGPPGTLSCHHPCPHRTLPPEASPFAQVGPPQHTHVWAPPTWLLILIGVLLAALVYGAVLLYLILKARNLVIVRRHNRAEPEAEQILAVVPTPEQVRAAVEASLAELIEGSDPRAAVIACWLRLESLAEHVGISRLPSDAPGDLVARMLDGVLTGPGVRALHTLAGVYRAARYSPQPVDESARDTARAALDRLRAELSVRDPVPSGGPSGGGPS